MTETRKAKLAISGSPLEGENPQPHFREPDPAAEAGEGFPGEKLARFGGETGSRILPYTKQDRYGRKLAKLELDSIVMENDFLRAEFLPSFGGRLWSLYDKKNRRDIVYRNPVFRPANLAIRDAWFSGGIEWNIGRFGHTVHTASPVFAGTLSGGDTSHGNTSHGDTSPVLRIWEFERQTRLFWRIDFLFSERAPVLYAYVRIENPDASEKPLYWWTSAAVPQTENLRVLSAADEVLFFVPGTSGGAKRMDGGKLPHIPPAPDRDASFPARLDFSTEYFFQCDAPPRETAGVKKHFPWAAAVDGDGYAFAETSTAPLLYRKMFSWGQGPGGRHWQQFLSVPGGTGYLEMQAGLAPTQLHTAVIPARGTVDFVQAFTGLFMDRSAVMQDGYRAACAAAGECIALEIGADVLEAALAKGRARAGQRPEKLFSPGSGWGALECRARPVPMPGTEQGCGYPPPGLLFPPESIGRAEKPWLSLLNTGAFPPWAPAAAPPGFPGTSDGDLWQPLLLLAPRREGDWLSPYCLGVIAFERGSHEDARTWWLASLEAAENPWALRNLALAEKRQGGTEKALEFYRRIFARFGSGAADPGSAAAALDRSFIEEFIPLLLETGLEDEAFSVLQNYAARKGSGGVFDGPLLECHARLAFARKDDAILDRIFSGEPSRIREGDNSLSDLWIAREVRRLAEKEKIPGDEAERRVRNALRAGQITIPEAVDFRLCTG